MGVMNNISNKIKEGTNKYYSRYSREGKVTSLLVYLLFSAWINIGVIVVCTFVIWLTIIKHLLITNSIITIFVTGVLPMGIVGVWMYFMLKSVIFDTTLAGSVIFKHFTE